MLIPGPTVLLVVSYGLGQGWRTALPTAIGVALGDFTAMTLSIIGIGVLLAASATVFTVLKWVGAAYLVWLGIQLWRAGGRIEAGSARSSASSRRMLAHAWLVTTLNPKGLVFFIAFVPQFVDPEGSFLLQVVIFEATFLVLAFANALGYAFAASQAGRMFRSARIMAAINRLGGTILIGAGVATVTLDRPG